MHIDDFTVSYAPKDEHRISRLAKEIDKEDLNSIGDIEENSISFRTIYIYETEESIEAKVFIINSTEQNINFEYLPLKIVNKDNEIVASEYVKVEDIGVVPTMNIRPFSIFFSKDSLVPLKSIDEECSMELQSDKIGAKLSNKSTADYIDSSISLYDKRIIEKYVENMPPVVKDKFRIKTYKSGVDEQGNKFSILILLNGSKNNVQIIGVNIIYKDENNIIKANKRIEKLPVIKGNSTLVMKIVLEKEDIIEEDFDIEECKVVIAQS